MKTKNIFKTLALAILMPALLLNTACNSDIINNENTDGKGFALPVTVNVTREGDDATKATYTDNGDGTGSLAFSAGDKLFVKGNHENAGIFAGTLDYDAVSGKFSGTIYTKNSYEGTAAELFTSASPVRGTLLPNGYGSTGFLSINNNSTPDDATDDYVSSNYAKAIALTKNAAVEQLSWEQGNYYSYFLLQPRSAILNFTITGLAASTQVAVVFTSNNGTVNENVTTDALGNATFALGVSGGEGLHNCSLSVAGNPITLVSSDKTLTAGKIYNITRSAAPAPTATDLSTISVAYTASDGETLTGTLGANVQISIAAGATVTLNNVTINGTNDSNWAGITCLGNATIILSGTNTVKGFYEDYPGIYVPVGNTVTIKGSGSLTASSNGYGAGIGGGFGKSCGNIEIQGGVITATGGDYAAGIGAASGVGIGESICGTITISGGTVTAIGGDYAAGIGSGYAQTKPSTCGAISISGGTVSATAGAHAPAAIGKGGVDTGESTCASVTFTPGITSLTLTNSQGTGIVSDFINATAVNADTIPITYMLPTSVTDPTITGGMDYFGFATSYDGGTKTWTITKK